LHKVIGRSDINFGGVTPLAELDQDGSNWSKSIFMSGTKEDVEVHAYVINKILIDVSLNFNIDDK